MQRAIIIAVLLLGPTVLHSRVIKWEGKPLSVSISTERLTRSEFPETLRSALLSLSDIGVKREEKSLYVRALAPDARGAGGRVYHRSQITDLDYLPGESAGTKPVWQQSLGFLGQIDKQVDAAADQRTVSLATVVAAWCAGMRRHAACFPPPNRGAR